MWKVISFVTACAACIPFAVHAQYHDAEAFEAKGPVREISITYTRPGTTILSSFSFSREGAITATSYGPILRTERDASGRLSKYVYNKFESSYYDLQYDDQGRVSRRSDSSEANTYSYDQQGLLVEETVEDHWSLVRIRYKYLAFDERGNWTKRDIERTNETYDTCEEHQEVRTIEYWPGDPGGEAGGSTSDGEVSGKAHARSHAQAEEAEQKGGFLDEAFANLAEGRSRQQEMARAMRERSLQRRAEAEAETETDATTAGRQQAATELTALSMIEYPLGILTASVTYDEAARMVAAREGWDPDLSEPVWIAMLASRGYQLAYNNFIPRASASFSEEGEHRLESYDYLFSYIRGGNFPESVPLALIHKKAMDMARKIVADWEAAGIEVREDPSADPSQAEFAMCAELGDRTIQIRVMGKDRNVVNEYYTVYVNVQMH